MLATIDNSAFSELMLALYGSTGSSGKPQRYFLTLLADMLNLKHAAIVYRCADEPSETLISCSGDAETGDRLFGKGGNAFDTDLESDSQPKTDAITRLLRQDPLGYLPFRRFTSIEILESLSDLQTSALDQTWFASLDIHYLGGIDWHYKHDARICARFTRSQCQGPFRSHEIELFNLLIPHLEQLVKMVEQLRQLDAERQLYADTISKQSIGILTLNDKGELAQSNRTGEAILQKGDGIRLSGRKLLFADQQTHTQFQQSISSYFKPGRRRSTPPTQVMAIVRKSGNPAYQLVIKCLPGQLYPVIMIRDPQAQLDISIRVLMELYRLTMSEATIAVLMAEGRSREQIAEDMSIKLNTVRAHLRSMYAKMGVSRQSMLVAQVISSLAATN